MAAIRRALLWLASFVYVAALFILLTGGGVVMLGTVRLSLRGARNPITIVLILTAIAWALAPRQRRWQTLAAEWSAIVGPIERALASLGRRGNAARTAAAAVALVIVAVGLLIGSHVAGGSDSFGYVSEARLLANGALRMEQPLLRDLPAGVPPETLVPLGYRLSPDGGSLVPTYPAGYPMLMALFERTAGPSAVFLVMPLMAGLAVWSTYLLGVRLAGPAIGLASAILVATSPAFLFALTHSPMSDIPAMAWWTLSLALAVGASGLPLLAAGLAAGAAILTRPNLVPLAIIVAAIPPLTARRSSEQAAWQAARQTAWQAVRQLALFAIGPLAAAGGIAALNSAWYGSPATSGYGNLAGVLYKWTFLQDNLGRYPLWLWNSQPWTLVAALFAALFAALPGGVAARTRQPVLWACGAFAAAVCLAYAFYLPLPDWTSLRLLLPAFPILCVVAALGVMTLPAAPAVLRTAVIVMMAALGIASARERDGFDSALDWRFATMGHYIADSLPEKAALLSMHHSGSAQFYSGRLTLRWDMLRPEQLDPLVTELRRRGYVPYLLLDDFEQAEFAARFKGDSRLGALDWEPVVTMPRVKLFAATSTPR